MRNVIREEDGVGGGVRGTQSASFVGMAGGELSVISNYDRRFTQNKDLNGCALYTDSLQFFFFIR